MIIALFASHSHKGITDGYIMISTQVDPDSKILREWFIQLVTNFRILHRRYSANINAFNIKLTHSFPCPNQLFRYRYDISQFIQKYPLYANEFILGLNENRHKHYYNTIFGLNIETLDIELLETSNDEFSIRYAVYSIDVTTGNFYMPDGKLMYNVLDLV